MLVAVSVALAAALALPAAAQTMEAICVFRPTATGDQTITGIARLAQSTPGGPVTVRLNVQGITTNPMNDDHGVHIHTYGDLSVDGGAGSSPGVHYGQLNASVHGCPPSPTRALGDLGNWNAFRGEIANVQAIADKVELSGPTSIIGRSIVLHSDEDDCVSPSASGSKLAACVLGIDRPVGVNATNPASQSVGNVTAATAEIHGTSNMPNVTGRVHFSQPGGVGPTTVEAWIDGLAMGSVHGFHIHQYGSAENADGTSSGGHYNPAGSPHRIPPSFPRHVGDMGNIVHYDAGTAYYKYTNDLISLNGPDSVVGRAVVVHASMDNCSQPTGAAGSRYAIGIIGIANPTAGAGAPTLPAGVPTTQDNSLCPADPTTGTTAVNPNTGAPTGSTGAETSAAGPAATALAALLAAGLALAH